MYRDLGDRDADGVRRARMLADRAEPQPRRHPEDEDVGPDEQRERQPDHEIELAEDRSDESPVLQEVEVDVRDSVVGDVTRSPGVSVLVHEQVAR